MFLIIISYILNPYGFSSEEIGIIGSILNITSFVFKITIGNYLKNIILGFFINKYISLKNALICIYSFCTISLTIYLIALILGGHNIIFFLTILLGFSLNS